MDSLRIETSGLSQLKVFFGELPQNVALNAVRAVNRGSELMRTEIATMVYAEIAFRKGYLDPSNERLYIKERATQDTMRATVVGRDRPTSLAQFIVGSVPAPSQRGGVTVMVKKGVSKFMPGAFVYKLKSGVGMDDENFNLGLAVRLKPGETLPKKREFVQMKNGLYLLYGPSVGQAMREILKGDSATLRRAADVTEAEFDRLMKVFK